jgi:DNA topoisomerase-1
MRVLGVHPDTGEEVTVRRGPYGLYVQLGEPGEDKKQKPRRTSLPRGIDGDQITLEQALGLLSLPRLIGIHPETREEIQAGIGRFGPYVRMGAVYGSLDRDDDVLAIGINRAVDLLAKKLASVRTIGPHPGDKELVSVRKGRFGPYVQHGKTVANLPRGVMMDDVTLDEAVALLKDKGKTLRPRGAGAKRGGRGAAAKQANGAGAANGATEAASAKRMKSGSAQPAASAAKKQAATGNGKAAKAPARHKAPAQRAAAAKSATPAAKQKAAAPAKKAATRKQPPAKAAAPHRAAR